MSYDAIYPGQPWLDTHGRRIQAHGGCVYAESGVYYWIGENKQFTHKGSKVWSWGVSAYSSTDLMNWRDEGLIIPPVPWDKKSPLHPNRRLDRPHIIHNPKTGKYVAWLKYSEKNSYFTTSPPTSCLAPIPCIRHFTSPTGNQAWTSTWPWTSAPPGKAPPIRKPKPITTACFPAWA